MVRPLKLQVLTGVAPLILERRKFGSLGQKWD